MDILARKISGMNSLVKGNGERLKKYLPKKQSNDNKCQDLTSVLQSIQTTAKKYA